MTEMFHHVLLREEEAEAEEQAGEDLLGGQKPKVVLRNKIQFVSKMLKMQKLLREENEHILKIKAMNNNRLPQGILLEGKEAIETFTLVKQADMRNEMRPDDD